MRVLSVSLLLFLLTTSLYAQGLEQAADGLEKLNPDAKPIEGAPYAPKKIGKSLYFDDWVTSACWIDNETVVFGSFDELRFYSADGKLVKKLSLDAGPVKSLLYVPSTQKLYAGCYQRILVIDPASHKVVARWKGHRGEINDLSLDASSNQIVSVSNDQSIRFWNLSDGEQTHAIENVGQPIYSGDVSPEGKLFAIGLGDESVLTDPGPVQLWSMESKTKIAALVPHKKQTLIVRFTPDGSKLLSGSVDERIHVYDVATQKPLGFFGGHSRPVNDLMILKDNDTVISASGGNYKKMYEVKFWRISEGEAFGSDEPHNDAVLAIAISPDQTKLATASQDKTAILWSLEKMPQTTP